MTRLITEFIMIPPDGEKMDYPAVGHFFHHTGTTCSGLYIVVDRAKIISEWYDGTAIRYCESQTLADDSENVCWSTTIFQQAEGKVVWRHLQETRLG